MKIKVHNQSLSVSDWAEELGVTRGAIYYRTKRFGETLDDAIIHFYNKRHPLEERLRTTITKVKEISDEMRGFKRYATSDSNDCRYVAYWLYQTFADRIDEAIKEFEKGETNA